MEQTCVHSCKGLCHALTVAEHHEEEALTEYRRFAAECDYPDVREVLDTLIADREKGLHFLRQKKELLMAKFNVIDRINDSFA